MNRKCQQMFETNITDIQRFIHIFSKSVIYNGCKSAGIFIYLFADAQKQASMRSHKQKILTFKSLLKNTKRMNKKSYFSQNTRYQTKMSLTSLSLVDTSIKVTILKFVKKILFDFNDSGSFRSTYMIFSSDIYFSELQTRLLSSDNFQQLKHWIKFNFHSQFD